MTMPFQTGHPDRYDETETGEPIKWPQDAMTLPPMGEIDHFVPADEARPYDLEDTETVPPVPDLYLPQPHKSIAARGLASERITFKSVYLTNVAGDVQRIVDQSESGIGFKVTIQIDPVSVGYVQLGASREDLEGNLFTPAGYTGRSMQGYTVFRAAGVMSAPLEFFTRAEIWARALGADGFLSVAIEQFYGD